MNYVEEKLKMINVSSFIICRGNINQWNPRRYYKPNVWIAQYWVMSFNYKNIRNCHRCWGQNFFINLKFWFLMLFDQQHLIFIYFCLVNNIILALRKLLSNNYVFHEHDLQFLSRPTKHAIFPTGLLLIVRIVWNETNFKVFENDYRLLG